ncbi:MAG: hypothetical protein HY062_18485 [Bacteroidetes bacterium]|nr:hypothetical protein [Bacteroidota bacterium]
MKSIGILVGLTLICCFSGCKKDAGSGGKATIKGKVYAKNYNSSATLLLNEYYIQGENVYITYGNDVAVADNVKTSYDGTYVFPYLRKGKYKIFVVSKDINSSGLDATVPVIHEVEITGKKQVIELSDLVIIK